MRGKQVVDALVDLVKVVVYLLEPVPLGEVWYTISTWANEETWTCRVVAHHSDDSCVESSSRH